MNSIDGVLARIQEIVTRIHEIQAKDGRVQGIGPSASASAQQSYSAPRATGNSSKALSATKTAQFQKLLNDALSTGAGSSPASGAAGLTSAQLGKLGNVGNLESILGGTLDNGLGNAGNRSGLGASGTGLNGLGAVGQGAAALGGSGATTPGLGNTGSLQQYRSELLQALQELAAQRKQHQSQ